MEEFFATQGHTEFNLHRSKIARVTAIGNRLARQDAAVRHDDLVPLGDQPHERGCRAGGVLPGGLGLRESLAAGIAATTGTAAAVGSVATLIVRFVSTVMLAVSAGVIALTRQEATT